MIVVTMNAVTSYCPECGKDRPFERPHEPACCPDQAGSPDGCCPEVACVTCGTALFLGLAMPAPLPGATVRADRRDSPERAA